MKFYDDAMTEIDRLIAEEEPDIATIKKIIEKYKGDVIKLEIFKK